MITLTLATLAWWLLTKPNYRHLADQVVSTMWRWLLVLCWIILSMETVRKVVIKWVQ
jgi:hypothetical protein